MTSQDRPHAGKACLEIRRDRFLRSQFCFAGQTIDAVPFRGRRVRFSGWLRYEASDSGGLLGSARISMFAGGHPWSNEGLERNPVQSTRWTFAQVTCEVAPDADSLNVGATLYQCGRAWFDDLAITALGPAGEGNEPPRALTRRGLENLTAFARLLGYVRHFHPSDEAFSADWDSFAIAGVEDVESARDAVDLKARLDRLFRPLAPTLRLSNKPLQPLTGALLRPGATVPGRIVGWQHRGWAGPYPGAYEQRRVVAPAESPGDSLLPICSEVGTSLGGGVWCSVPLTLYVDTTGRTIPSGAGSTHERRRPEGWVPTGADRSTRLADVILFWNVMEHFFPYFDEVGTDWQAQLAPALQAAALDRDGAAFDTTLRKLASTLKDGHIYVASPYRSLLSPRWPFEWTFVDKHLIVTSVDSSLVAGARVGDEVLRLDGHPVAELVRKAEPLQGSASPQRTRLRVARALMQEAGPDSLSLDLRSPAGSSRRVRVARVKGSVTLSPIRPDSVQELRPGVMYLDLNRITEADLQKALPAINAGDGVIFDLRGYPNRIPISMLGYLADSTIESPRWGVPVVLRPDHRDMRFDWSQWSIEPRNPRIRARAAFLIDANAISAAETLLGIVEHYHLADLVGEPTAGTNGTVTSVLLPGRYSTGFTGMKVLKEDGSRLHGIGIQPTVPVSRSVSGIAAGRDEQLERAIEVVLTKASLTSGK